jgi:hypothetical protein
MLGEHKVTHPLPDLPALCFPRLARLGVRQPRRQLGAGRLPRLRRRRPMQPQPRPGRARLPRGVSILNFVIRTGVT